MILADTSIWVEHFKKGRHSLAALLDRGAVLAHPWVVGELALGGITHQALALMTALPRAATASEAELLGFIAREHLAGSGIGYVDTQLLAAARLTPDCRLWTADQKLRTVAERVALGYRPA